MYGAGAAAALGEELQRNPILQSSMDILVTGAHPLNHLRSECFTFKVQAQCLQHHKEYFMLQI